MVTGTDFRRCWRTPSGMKRNIARFSSRLMSAYIGGDGFWSKKDSYCHTQSFVNIIMALRAT